MTKFICKGPIPGRKLASYFCHADPDHLSRLMESATFVCEESANALATEFSKVLHDVRVSGVWKRTGPKRLAETERLIAARVRSRRDDIFGLDMGASDGSTTLDLLGVLRASTNGMVRMFLGDLHLWLTRHGDGLLVEYRTTSGEPVMVRAGRLGLRLPRSEHYWDIPSNLLAKWYLSLGSLRAGLQETARIPLISPLVLKETAITPIEMNCFVANRDLIGRLDVIRASNILNREYFTLDQIRVAAQNLRSYLKDDGVLIVSRNVDAPGGEAEHGTLWRRRGVHLVREENFGQGSEVADVVDSMD